MRSITFPAIAFFVLFFSSGLFAQPEPTESFLPLTNGSATYIRSWYGGGDFGFIVENSKSYGATTIARVKVENPWFPYSWLVFEDARGTWITGIYMQGRSYHFGEPSPFLMKGGETGTTWNGEMTRVVQTGSNLTVSTSKGIFHNASRFRITFSDESVQEWTVVPGVGIIASGATSTDFVLMQQTVGTPQLPVLEAPLSGEQNQCTYAGVSTIPMDATLNIYQRQQALIPAIEMKAKFNVSTISWSELEPQATRYKTARIADEFNLATAASMKAALIIRTVDSHIAHRPADLQGLEWDHPAVVLRFTTAVTNLLGKLQVQPEWLHLAYEVEPYFDAHPQELPAFKRFLTEVKAELKKVSNASIGIVFGFDATKAHNQAFQELESICDHIAFDYYALRSQAGFSHVSAENPSFDIPLMLHFAGDRKVLLTEAGYASSHAVNGSNEKQKVFFERLFQEIAASKGQIAAVNVWSMNDMPIDIVQQVIDGYSLEVPGVVPFLSSLGIRTSNGTPKPAYSTLMNHFNALHETCSTQ